MDQTEAYTVLARKWRPAQFSDIVGQDPIVRTLANAIQKERIHQAYLFTGSRGIGKTSIARIFAKLIRCEKTKEKSGILQSCDACSNCDEIASSRSVDVIEIDGASNNGVDAVREIRENVKFLPASGSRKIYIIDEVHMLTTAAFNALLKTLEEPPAHVIFVFATTEPHKIPPTILSRCQAFDFKRVSSAQIQNRLKEILKAEKLQAEAGALSLISKAAEGSMRDALSVLDQVIAFAGKKITAEDVRESVGLIGTQTLYGILGGIFQKKPEAALEHVQKAFETGYDFRILTEGLIETLHAAICTKVLSDPKSLDFSEAEWNELKELAAPRSLEELELIFQVVHHGLDRVIRSPQPKLILDVLVIKCAAADALIPISSGKSAGPSVRPAAPVTKAASLPVSTPRQTERAAPAQEERVLKAMTPSAPPQKTPTTEVTEVRPRKKENWVSFIEFARGKRPLVASMLEHATCEFQEHILEIHFSAKDSYKSEQVQTPATRQQLESLVKEFFGRDTVIQVHLVEKKAGESVASQKKRIEKEREVSLKEKVEKHPIIQEAKALFGENWDPYSRGGKVVDLRADKDPPNNDPVSKLIFELSKLPGIGEKTATRLAFYILKQNDGYAQALANALLGAREKIRLCEECCTFTDESPCRFCADPKRTASVICVVERPSDMHSVDQSMGFRGKFHVLHGVLSPLDGVGPEELKIRELMKRISDSNPPVNEVIFATNPSVEGDATAMYLARLIQPLGIKTSKLAHGLPVGGQLEYTDRQTIRRAIENRVEMAS